MDYAKELETLFDTVIAQGASDLHLSEGRKPTLRVSGFLVPLENKNPLGKDDTNGLMSTLLTPIDKERFLGTKEIDFGYSYGSKARFRGNCYFQQGMISITLRMIPREIKTIEQLNLPPELADFARKPQGFFLVV